MVCTIRPVLPHPMMGCVGHRLAGRLLSICISPGGLNSVAFSYKAATHLAVQQKCAYPCARHINQSLQSAARSQRP